MPEEIRGLGDLEEEAVLEQHVAVLVGERTQVVVLAGELTLEFLERAAQHLSNLLAVLFFCFVLFFWGGGVLFQVLICGLLCLLPGRF